MADEYRVRPISNAQRSQAMRVALNSGRRVKITSGQSKAIRRTAVAGRTVKRSK